MDRKRILLIAAAVVLVPILLRALVIAMGGTPLLASIIMFVAVISLLEMGYILRLQQEGKLSASQSSANARKQIILLAVTMSVLVTGAIGAFLALEGPGDYPDQSSSEGAKITVPGETAFDDQPATDPDSAPQVQVVNPFSGLLIPAIAGGVGVVLLAAILVYFKMNKPTALPTRKDNGDLDWDSMLRAEDEQDEDAGWWADKMGKDE